MKKSFSKIVTACLLAAFALSTTIHAEDKKEEKPANAAANGMPMRGKLGAVDTKNKTITVEGKEKSRTFQVTSQTRIMKDGKPATLEDAKVGEEVGGFATKTGEDKYELRSLRLGAKPEAEKQHAEKAEKKK
jgi:hypothetical protein